jgi:hypothetical protein
MKLNFCCTGALLACLPLMGLAPSTRADVLVSPKADIKIKDLPPVVRATPAPMRTKIGERYKLWLSFSPTEVNDPMYPGKPNPYDDHRFECYGKLLVNGVNYWEMPKYDVQPASQNVTRLSLPEPLKVDARRQGYRLNTGKFSKGGNFVFDAIDNDAAGSTVRISLKLYDSDKVTFFDEAPYPNGLDRTDDLFGDFNLNLDLRKMSEGHYYWFWNGKDGNGNAVGSNLYLYIEHVKTLYGSASSGTTFPKPHVPPQLPEQRPIPRQIPRTSPIFKSGPLLKTR